jgi:hypothetical protein
MAAMFHISRTGSHKKINKKKKYKKNAGKAPVILRISSLLFFKFYLFFYLFFYGLILTGALPPVGCVASKN